jgi:hypothetical protein
MACSSARASKGRRLAHRARHESGFFWPDLSIKSCPTQGLELTRLGAGDKQAGCYAPADAQIPIEAIVARAGVETAGEPPRPQPAAPPVDPVAEYEIYRRAAQALERARVPYLVGGAFALGRYTALVRQTKDLDLFVRPEHLEWALDGLTKAGFTSSVPFPHWLGKAQYGGTLIDIIFSSGNGVAIVDDEWFAHSQIADVLGLPLPVCPAEEMIWSKAFVLERERFDGADVLHVVRDCGPRLDWQRLLRRFGPQWRVLYAHLVLFGFVYPGERDRVPAWVLKTLARRMEAERENDPGAAGVCRGTLLSREQYLVDVERLGYVDGRLASPEVHMSPEDVAVWTEAIPGRKPHE